MEQMEVIGMGPWINSRVDGNGMSSTPTTDESVGVVVSVSDFSLNTFYGRSVALPLSEFIERDDFVSTGLAGSTRYDDANLLAGRIVLSIIKRNRPIRLKRVVCSSCPDATDPRTDYQYDDTNGKRDPDRDSANRKLGGHLHPLLQFVE